MLILLYIFLGLLFFDCLVACCLYFRKERLFDTPEVQLNHLKIVKLTKYGKTAKDNRTPGFKQYEEQLNYLGKVESTE
jgi:hypothetical protein